MSARPKAPRFMPTLEAAAETARLLEAAGLEIEPAAEDLDRASAVVRDVAREPSPDDSSILSRVLHDQTPASVLLIQEILKEYGNRIVHDAEAVRNLVMNRLLEETSNADPKIRIRALELLGKMTDVGVFTERREVVVTHQSADDVRQRLRARLAKLIPDAEIVPGPAAADLSLPSDGAILIEHQPVEEGGPGGDSPVAAPASETDAMDEIVDLPFDLPAGPIGEDLFG